jgi:hypothetical protein
MRGFALGVGLIGLCLWSLVSGSAAAPAYIPDGPDVPAISLPAISLNKGQSGVAGPPPLPVPRPNQWDQQSIWNMQALGFQDNQGRASSDDGWIENQNGRYIAYMANSPGKALNALTGKIENNGTSLIDVTDVAHPRFLSHIPVASGGGATHLAVCGGNTLPHAERNHWYLLRHDGQTNQEIWDVTNPTAPELLTVIISGLNATHHDWWECDTGIAYTISQTPTDGWQESGSHQHVYIYDLGNPTKPLFIRQFGLVGQQPEAPVATARSCINAPGPSCYEGVTNPPGGIHQIYSAGVNRNRVYLAYGVDYDGVFQILDRQKLLDGCKVPSASPQCATRPTQADLLYPQISYIATNPNQGGHTAIPIFGVPIREEQQNYLDGKPQRWNLLAVTSEETTNDCFGQPWKNPFLLDITDERSPWPIAVLDVGQFPGDFCAKGARFGVHELNRQIYPPYYGRLLIVAMFNAGLQVWDIRDPYRPRRVAYFIQAPNKNTRESCGTYRGNAHYCRKAIFSDLGEVDDRGYIYNFDRSGSGLTILKLTGAALQVVAGEKHDQR